MVMLVVDSGLGGISVVRALKTMRPELSLHYLADTAFFPYGSRSAEALNTRASTLMAHAIQLLKPSVIVLACNTLSTLCLEPLRRQCDTAFVGTVPPIKVASALSKTKRFTLLATPNTAASNYSANLIKQFASDCVVDCYGAPHLASMAEAYILHHHCDTDALRQEIAPCFLDDARDKTDCVVLGCTHYPLLKEKLEECSPWPVHWIDASDAIARQALSLLSNQNIGSASPASHAWVTSATAVTQYKDFFTREGFVTTSQLDAFADSESCQMLLSTVG